MKPLRARVLLLLAAVLIGQWLSFAHASQHNALEPDRSLCAYCVSDIGSGGTAAAPSLPVLAALPEIPAVFATGAMSGLALSQPRNRGPPHSS